MKKVFIQFILLLLSVVATGKEINLIIPEYKPYTYTDSNGNLAGIGVEKLNQYLKELGMEYTISVVPNHRKALEDVKMGKADGFFLASKNSERDEICEFSESVVINRWSWCMLADSNLNPKDESFKKNNKIGVILNTNQQNWAKDNGYRISAKPKDESIPPKMLKLRRADAFLMADLVFWAGVNENEKKNFKTITEKEKNFGVYISKEYLSKNPNFMAKLNELIKNDKQ